MNGRITLETKATGKPSAGNRHAGFDEAGAGNVPTGAGLRPGAKAPEEPPDPTGGAPALDPTDERRLETEPRRGVRHRHRRKPPGTATPSAYRHRASRRLYLTSGGQIHPMNPGSFPETDSLSLRTLASKSARNDPAEQLRELSRDPQGIPSSAVRRGNRRAPPRRRCRRHAKLPAWWPWRWPRRCSGAWLGRRQCQLDPKHAP